MKIHKQEATFKPIAIILESQEEVDQMYTLAGYNKFYGGDITDSIHAYLMDCASKSYTPVGVDRSGLRKFK